MADHEAKTSVSKSNPLAYLKAIAGGIVTGAFVLTSYVQGPETLADVTTNEWLFVVIAIAGVFGITYVVPNRSTGTRTPNP